MVYSGESETCTLTQHASHPGCDVVHKLLCTMDNFEFIDEITDSG